MRRLVELTKPRPVAATLRRHLGRAAGRAVVNALLFSAPIVGFYSMPGADSFGVGELDVVPPLAPSVVAEAVASRAEVLAERHGCWSGEAPADMVGVVPGRVVVSEVGREPRVAGSRMVGLALEQIFEGADHDLLVHAFCR